MFTRRRFADILGSSSLVVFIALLTLACGREEKAPPTAPSKAASSLAPAAANTASAATTPLAAGPDITKVKWDTFPPKMREWLDKNWWNTFKRPEPYKPIYGGVVRMAGSGTTLGRNYVKMSNIRGWQTWGTVSGNLMAPRFGWGADLSSGTGVPQPELAESWTSNKDGTEWTFKLRDNVYWQDKPPVNGRKVTGQDVKWYIETVQKEGWLAGDAKDISSVELPDDRTVVIKTSKPFPDMLQFLATPQMAMTSQECYAQEKQCVETFPVGFGPFQVKEMTTARMLLERNPKYPLKDESGNLIPYIDGIEYFPITDAATYDANWRVGKLDYRLVQDYPTYAAMKNYSPDIHLELGGPYTTSSLQGEWVVFNFEKDGPWQDKRVRQALSLAIDRQRVCDIAVGGYCLAQSPINFARDLGRPIEFSLKEMEELSPYHRYDPEKAKKLLAEAGYPNGFTVDVMTNNLSKGMGSVEVWLEVFKDWEKIGVKVKHDANQEQYVALQKRAYPGIMGAGYALSGARPYQMAYSLMHSQGAANFIKLNDPKLDQMLEQWRFLPLASPERKQASIDMFNYINEQMYRPTLWVNPNWLVSQPWITNLVCGSDTCTSGSLKVWSWAWIDPSAKGFPAERKFEPRGKP